MTHDELIQLRNDLRGLGYDARLVFGGCFDIHQDGWIHYLSGKEAEMLRTAAVNHAVDLMEYSVPAGLNRAYKFPQ